MALETIEDMLAAAKARGKTHTSGPIHGIIARDRLGLSILQSSGWTPTLPAQIAGTSTMVDLINFVLNLTEAPPALVAAIPNLAQQLQPWRRERIQNEPDPTDFPPFRAHEIDNGAPDPGPDAFPGFAF